MKRFIARRLLQGVVLLFLVATIVFFVGRLTGNPVDLMLPEDATAEDRARLVQTLGLLRWPFLVPYLSGRYQDESASPATREALTVVFETIHQYLGVAVGEHVG